MLTFIPVGMAVIINFYSPKLSTIGLSSRSDLTKLGFPYFYYQGESLSEDKNLIKMVNKDLK